MPSGRSPQHAEPCNPAPQTVNALRTLLAVISAEMQRRDEKFQQHMRVKRGLPARPPRRKEGLNA